MSGDLWYLGTDIQLPSMDATVHLSSVGWEDAALQIKVGEAVAEVDPSQLIQAIKTIFPHLAERSGGRSKQG
jgi:hypothetical protein